MSDPDSALAPDKNSEKQSSGSIQINQFIQLVNQNQHFPEASLLNGYDPETRAWILKRTEIEQEERHQLMNKLIDNDHELNLESSKNNRQAQTKACLIVVVVVLSAVFLLYFNKKVEALSTLLVPLGMMIVAVIYKKIDQKMGRELTKP